MIKSTRLRSTLSASTILAAGLLLVVAPAQAQNLPDMGNVSVSTSGLSGGAPGSTNPGFSTSGRAGAQTLRVDLKDNRTILNWGGTGFNVAAGNTVDFKDARATSGVTGRTDNIAVLNRDLSGTRSNILGTIKSDANVAVYVINRNGIVLGDSTSAQNAIDTGSFFASTSDISDDNSFLNGSNTLNFSQQNNGLLSINNVRITTSGSGGTSGGRLGDVVLVGSFGNIGSFETPGPIINAAGDMLIANARTFIFQNAPDSPLSLAVTSAGNPTSIYGDITARNITIGSYFAGDGQSVNFSYTGAMTATGAAATDRGVVLYAQSTDTSLPASPSGPQWVINQAVSAPPPITSAKGVSLTGAQFSLNSEISATGTVVLGSPGYNFYTSRNVTGGTIDLNATGGLFSGLKSTVGDITFNGATTFTLQGNVNAARDLLFPSIKLLKLSCCAINMKAGRNISITASDGIDSSGVSGAIDAGGFVSIKTPFVGLASMDVIARGGSITVDTDGIGAGSMTAADRVDIIARGGIGLGTVTAPNGIKLTALGNVPNSLGDVEIISAVATGINSDIVVTASGVFFVRGQQSATPVIDAGRDILVQAGGHSLAHPDYGADLSNARAGRNIQVSASGIGATDLVATTGFITLNSTDGSLSVSKNLRAGQYITGIGTYLGVANAVAGNGTLSLTANGGDLAISGTSSATGSITLHASGQMTLGATSLVTGGDLIASGNGVDIHSTYDPTNLLAPLSIKAAGAISINAGTGYVRGDRGAIQANSDGIGAEALTIEAGAGMQLITDLLGGTDRQSDVRLRFSASKDLMLGGVKARSLLGASGNGAFTTGLVTSASARVYGAIDLINTFSLQASTMVSSQGVSIRVSGGDIRLNVTDTSTPFILRMPLTASGDIEVRTSSTGFGIDVDGRLSGRNVALSTPGAFVNNRGADAIAATGHWIVYSASPDGDTFGGLDSGNTAYWNANLATRDPNSLTGNRYVFAYQPTLIFSTQNFSKVYGTDLTGAGASNIPFAVTGYQSGVAGAFLEDTAMSAFSGRPLITSTGFAARATVAGGPYAQAVALGSLSSDSGYAIAIAPSTGMVTVTPKALTANVIANNKTYDGTTTGTGTVMLNGVVAGDTVGTGGTIFTFGDKNAGTAKTVTVAGTTLTGADAGNYTVTVPASVLADILKKAITASVTANSKTYDGTTAGTGTVTLNGLVSGDAVGTAGTTFTFADKNAGTGKTVTVAGTTLTGADAGNYTVTVPAAALADILRKAITASVVAHNKTYDGTTSGTGTVTLNGVVAGDAVGANGTTFTFSDKNAGTGKTVTVAGTTLTGTDAGNYTVTVPASTLADILKKSLTASVVAGNKTYDGTTSGTGTVTLNGVVSGDAVGTSGTTFTFADKNAGAGKTVNVAGTTLTGADAGNYTVTVPASALADILKKAITASVSVNSKTYDGTTAGSGTVTLNGVVSGDNVTTSGTTFTYADKNAGTGKNVAVAGTTIGGADAGNYTITIPASALGDILKRALSVTADDASKVRNDPDPALTYMLASGSLVSGDAFSGNVVRDAGENPGTYAIRIGTLSAGDNYTITFTPGTFTINLPLGSEGLQPALKAQPLPSQISADTSSGSSVNLDTSAVCGDDKNCTTGKQGK